MFKKLSFEKSIELDFSVEVKIWIEEDEVHYSKKGFLLNFKEEKDAISPITKEDFIKKLEAINIPSWKKNYEDDSVLDGFSWSVKYETEEDKPFKSSGENVYPANWKALQQLVEEVAGDLK